MTSAMNTSADPGMAGPLAGATLAFLKRYPPFDKLEADALEFMAGRLALGYYPKDAVILAPDRGAPDFFYIIQRGLVHISPEADDPGAAREVLALGPGECFSVGALLEKRPVTSPYVAAADTFCYQLTSENFATLIHRSARAQEFATSYLTSMLRESRQLLKMQFAGMATEQQAINGLLRALIRRPPVSCRLETPIVDALRTMHAAKIGSIIVVTPGNEPLGIFTRYDILDRIALARADLEQPIATVMTAAPHVISADASAHDAALAMAHQGIRHLPVVDGGRLVGVVTERDLFALQQVSMREIRRTIARSDGVPALADAARDIRRLAHDMLQQGVAAWQLTQIISTLNDALTRRLIKLEHERHGIRELNWCWLALGSEGRYEQTLATDQDNGLIFEDGREAGAESIRERLLPFARSVNDGLDACGFPQCKGGIMAGNPHWCLSVDEWYEQFVGWIRNPHPEALLKAVIFFDFRPVYGRDSLAESLRERLFGLTRGNNRFLRVLAEAALTVGPPLGLLRDFVVAEEGEHRGTLNLKFSGARLFVDAARLISLATATAHTGTEQRLRQGGARINISGGEIDALVEAFYFIQLLRLRSHDSSAPNHLDPGTLNEVDHRILKECFRQARKLQSRLALDYQL
jgi:CBS domain-containing protein